MNALEYPASGPKTSVTGPNQPTKGLDHPVEGLDNPVTFEWVVSLAMTSREPCRSVATRLVPGDPVRLKREPTNPHDPRAIAVWTGSAAQAGSGLELTAGYLYAAEAGLLYLLLDRDPPLSDRSVVEAILPPGHSRRSAIVRIRIRLDLRSAKTLYLLIAMLEIKDERFPRRFDFALNPWLSPLLSLHQAYRSNHDQFTLPDELIRDWIDLSETTGKAENIRPAQPI